MKLSPRVLVITFVMVLMTAAAASAQTVYVSGGPNIYAVDSGSGSSTLIFASSNSGSNFESLAIGPDYLDFTDASNTNAFYPFLLYACDTATNQVIRLAPVVNVAPQPTYPLTSFQLVYSGAGVPPVPVCGRSTSTGDFYITDKSGSGVYLLGANGPLANTKFLASANGGSAIASASLVSGSNISGMTGRGITQKYVGDLLVVDNAQNKVLRGPYGSFGTLSAFGNTANSNLSSPVGISRISTGDVFVANSILSSKNKNQSPPSPVAHFDRTGNLAAACPGLSFNSNQTPAYLATAMVAPSQTAVTDTIYLVTTANSSGTLWSWNTAQQSCTLTQVATIKNLLSGAAVAPALVTLQLPVNSLNAATTFSFNANLFQLAASTPCTATVEAYPLIPPTVQQMIGLAATNGLPDGGSPAPNLGDQGYETVYVAHWTTSGCTPLNGTGYETAIAAFVDPTLFLNPRVLQCDNLNDPSSEPLVNPATSATTCMVPQTLGVYPTGGPIVGDQYVKGNSVFALVNSGLSGAANTTNHPGLFCGYQSPLLNPNQPGYPKSFNPSTTTTVNVKFKLADLALQGTCKNGPYITNASALISVAQIADSTGATVFNAIDVNPTASSLQPPLYNTGNQQYSFTLNISTFAPGTYSLNTTFLTDNATNQPILFLIQ